MAVYEEQSHYLIRYVFRASFHTDEFVLYQEVKNKKLSLKFCIFQC